MKKRTHFLLLILGLVSISCATTNPGFDNTPLPEDFDTHFYDSITTTTITEGQFKGQQQIKVPDQIQNGFIMEDGKSAYVVTHFVDLVPNKKYKFKFKWYQPNGTLLGSAKVNQNVTYNDWYITHNLHLDHKYNHPSGLWKVEVVVNGKSIDTKEFVLAKNEEELSQLKAKHFGPYILSSWYGTYEGKHSSSGTISNWDLFNDGSMTGKWRTKNNSTIVKLKGVYKIDGFNIVFKASGFLSPNNGEKSPTTVHGSGTIAGNNAYGVFKIAVDNAKYGDDQGIWEVTKTIK